MSETLKPLAFDRAALRRLCREYLDTNGYEEITKDERILWLPDFSGEEAIDWLLDFAKAINTRAPSDPPSIPADQSSGVKG